MWANLLIGLVFSFISYLLQPKPEVPKAATLDDFNLPRANEGDVIGKPYGTVWITSPQIPWYGDFKSKAIKSSGGKK